MTTAHRPTWKAAVGQANEGGWTAGGAVSHQTSALDAPAHTRLKFRQAQQGAEKQSKQALLEESLRALEAAEKQQHQAKIGKRPVNAAVEERAKQRLLKQTAEVDLEKIKKKYDDSDIDDGGGGGNNNNSSEEESDLDDNDDDSDLDNDDSSDDSDDDDDEAALQAELAKIRAEREAQKRQQEAAAAAADEAQQEEAAVLGNPLLNNAGTATAAATGQRLKRRWNDDAVFRHQAKSEPAPRKRFINDTVRNDFHKRFLNKFIR